MFKYLVVLGLLVAPQAFAENAANDFTGTYISIFVDENKAEDEGVEAGGEWRTDTNADGQSLGMQIGYNWQLQNNIVVGVEADYANRINSKGLKSITENGVLSSDFNLTTQMRSSSALNARFGYKVQSNALVCVLAGYGSVDLDRSYVEVDDEYKTFADTQTGWTTGVGVEYRFETPVYVRLAYRDSDFGSEKKRVDIWEETFDQSLTEQSVRITISRPF